MKNIIFTLFISVVVLSSTYTQDSIPFIKFIDPIPSWKVATYDPTFIKDPLGYYKNGYEGTRSLGIRPYRDKMVVVENTLGQALYSASVGLLMTMINQSDGSVEWVHPWTENTGLKYKEFYSFFNFELDDTDASITLGSCRDTAILNLRSSAGRNYFCRPSLRTVDLKNGELVRQYNNTEDNYFAFSEDGSRMIINKKKQKYFITHYPSIYDTAFVNNVYIQPMDDEAKYDLDRTFVISDTSTVPYQIKERNYFPGFSDIDRNTMVVFMGDNYINDRANSPKRLTMYIVDISDKDDISIKLKKDITDLLSFPQSNGFMAFQRINSGFIIGFSLRDDDNNSFYYFNLFDRDGNHIVKVDTFELNGKRYFGNFSVGEYNNEFYFNAVYNQTSTTRGIDLLKINLINGKLSLVKELKFEQDGRSSVAGISNSYMDKEGNAYMCFYYGHQNTRYYNQYYKFSAASLGIISSVADIDLKSMTVYPNPANELLNIDFDEFLTKGIVTVENVQGQVILSDEINHAVEAQVSVAGLAAGLYFVKIKEEGRLTYISKFIKI